MKKFVLFMILFSVSLFFAGCEKPPVEPVDPELPNSVMLNIKVEANCRISRAEISIPVADVYEYSLPKGEDMFTREKRLGINYEKFHNEEVFMRIRVVLDLSNTSDGPYYVQYKTMTKLMDDPEEDIYFFFDYNDGDMRE